MEKANYRNAEQYADPTAYKAMNNVLRQQYAPKRGEVRWIEWPNGVETTKSPAVIVSDDRANAKASVKPNTVGIVYINPPVDLDLSTHVTIRSVNLGDRTIAMVEKVTTVRFDRIGEKIGELSDQEMQEIDAVLMLYLGLGEAPKKPHNIGAGEEAKPAPAPVPDRPRSVGVAEIAALRAERDVYQMLYNDMLERLVKV